MKPKKKKVVAKGADRADVRGDRKAARINKRQKRKYEEGGKLPSYDPKKAAMMRGLEAQIKKAKGTPAAKPLVEKYRKLTGTK